MTKATNVQAMYYYCTKLVTVPRFNLSAWKNLSTTNTPFYNCLRLAEITSVEGSATNDITFQYSPLNVETMKRVINTLTNYAGTTSEGKYKLTFTTACWTALEADSTAPDGSTWREYVQNVLGWNI